MKVILILLLFFFAAPLFAAEARDPAQVRQELDALEAEIQKFRGMLERTQGERTNLESSLEDNEKDINQILNRINSIQTDLKKGEDKLSSLSGKERELDQQKIAQQGQIALQIRAAYELGQQPYLKVLLNQEDPQKVERMLTYFSHITDARRAEITAYESTIIQLANLSQLIEEQNHTLLDQRVELRAQQDGLIEARKDKEQVLVLLNQEIKSTDNELEQRIADRQRLDDLLVRITTGITNLASQTDTRPFAQMQGDLYLPVAGRVTQSFGSRRADGKLRWNGLLIEASEGDPVHAVHYGRVVFSDWLRGFGLLMIVSHGDGYMSLYGHNQVLYRETGDWVAAGEMVASVGNTGGQTGFGLYFEIRSAGKPFDPQLWCQIRSSTRAA
ncbi:MAG: septal ring factor EnvC (AmiA/AmiB activator) [Candidatus Azotimanducaceae bacterium]|jgi:septal ring factor EnvC (AmiA/AmiB activator)